MRNIRNFYDLDTWKKGHELVLKIYKMTEGFPEKERYGITNQIQRASTSITANISEGFARFHFKDKIRFYYQARGSIAEVQNFLLITRDLNYINNDKCTEIGELANEIARLTNGLINSTNQQNNKQS